MEIFEKFKRAEELNRDMRYLRDAAKFVETFSNDIFNKNELKIKLEMCGSDCWLFINSDYRKTILYQLRLINAEMLQKAEKEFDSLFSKE